MTLRFVLLHHTASPTQADHYDLMLQMREGSSDDEPVFKTFSTLADDVPKSSCLLRPSHDHRKLYLHFEGPISGGRGKVHRVDEGELTWIQNQEPLQFRLNGASLKGEFSIANEGGIYILRLIN